MANHVWTLKTLQWRWGSPVSINIMWFSRVLSCLQIPISCKVKRTHWKQFWDSYWLSHWILCGPLAGKGIISFVLGSLASVSCCLADTRMLTESAPERSVKMAWVWMIGFCVLIVIGVYSRALLSLEFHRWGWSSRENSAWEWGMQGGVSSDSKLQRTESGYIFWAEEWAETSEKFPSLH